MLSYLQVPSKLVNVNFYIYSKRHVKNWTFLKVYCLLGLNGGKCSQGECVVDFEEDFMIAYIGHLQHLFSIF